jgi:hypothetical protein
MIPFSSFRVPLSACQAIFIHFASKVWRWRAAIGTMPARPAPGNRQPEFIHVACVKLGHVNGVSAQAAFGALDTL